MNILLDENKKIENINTQDRQNLQAFLWKAGLKLLSNMRLMYTSSNVLVFLLEEKPSVLIECNHIHKLKFFHFLSFKNVNCDQECNDYV